MPGQTPTWDLRFPLYTDAINPAQEIKNLATDVNTKLGTLQGALNSVQTKIRAQITNGGTQAIAINTPTDAIFATEAFDNDNMANLGVNNTALTVNTAGVYLILGRVSWAANTGGERRILLKKSTGTQTLAAFREPGVSVGGETTTQDCIVLAYCPVGALLRMEVLQNVAATLNIGPFTLSATRLAG